VLVTLRLVVVDDDPDYRLLVRLALDDEADLLVAGEATSADELLGVVDDDVDLVLLDASLPGALAAVPTLRAARPGARLVLTSSLPARHVADAVARVAAVGSLAKDIPLRGLPVAVRQLGSLVEAAERALQTRRTMLPQVAASARASRQVLLGVLDGWISDETRDAAALLISELVTNVVRHAATDVDVRIAVGARTVRVEVSDRNPEVPVLRSPAPTDVGGRGMRIVDELSLRWGVEARRTGKCVWFELPRHSAEVAR
jgi:DNA-binding NarL/FixJ family response regulator